MLLAAPVWVLWRQLAPKFPIDLNSRFDFRLFHQCAIMLGIDSTYNDMEDPLKRISRVVATTCALALATPAFASGGFVDFNNEEDVQWENISISWDQDSADIEDIRLMISGSDVYTDVFDDGGELYTIEAETYDVTRDTYFECEDDGLHKTVDGSNSLYFTCDGKAADYAGLNHTIQKGYYFWEGGDKFRVDWKVTNTSAAPLTLSAEVRNNFGEADVNSHYQFGNSTDATSQQWGNDLDATTDIQEFEARWAAHYDINGAPIGFAWGSDAATNTGVVSDYDDDDLDIVYENLTIPANDFIYIAVYYAWPAATMVAANYDHDSNPQPFSFVQEAATEIAAMQASPTSQMTALIDDVLKVVNWQSLPAAEPAAPAPYSGPLLKTYSDRNPSVGDEIDVSGLRLDLVTSLTIDGVTAVMSNQSEDSFTIVIPAGLEPGLKDLVITSSAGTLTVQDAITVSAAAEDASESSSGVSAKGWTKKLTDSSAKIYAKDVVGAGKVQIFFNGKEIAWVHATTESDPKLRTANDSHYLVRTVELVKGQKNTLEVYLDGERIRRAAYSY